MGGVERDDREDNNASVEDASVEGAVIPPRCGCCWADREDCKCSGGPYPTEAAFRQRIKGSHPYISQTILEEAQEIIHGERNKHYGEPAKNHGTTAELMNVFLKRKYGLLNYITADDVCWFNIFQKISREAHSPQRDNLVDIAGYVGNIEMMQSAKV